MYCDIGSILFTKIHDKSYNLQFYLNWFGKDANSPHLVQGLWLVYIPDRGFYLDYLEIIFGQIQLFNTG